MSADLGTIFYQIDAKAEAFLTTSKTVDRQIAKTETGLSDVEKQMAKTNAASQQLGGGLTGVASALKAVAAAAALREIAGMVQGYQEMSDRVRLATSSVGEFEAVQARLVQTANGTYRSLKEAQELFIGSSASLKALGYTTQQALDVTDSLSYAFVTNAVNAERASAVTQAFAKSMAKGKVDADAWMTISNSIDTVVQSLATSTGKTTGQILALGAAGKITARDLSEALRKSLDDNAKAAANMANNLTDAATRMSTALTAVFVEVENQTGAWQALTDGIIKAADWILKSAGSTEKMSLLLDTATASVLALSSVIAGRLIMSMGSYLTQQGLLIASLVRQSLAERAAATAALATAQAQKAAALSSAERTRAIAAEAAAQARLNSVTTAGAVAARGLGTAMKFLGGPAGIVLLAASAIATFSSNAAAARGPVEGLAEAVGTLGTRALELQKIQLMEKIQEMGNLGGAASNTAARIESLQKNLQEFPNSAKAKEWTKDLAEQRAAAEAAGGELGKYRDRMKEIEAELGNRAAGRNAPTGGTPDLVTPVDSKGAEAAAKKRAQAMAENVKAVEDLARANREAALSGVELAQSQALANLNKSATPEQIAKVKELAQAIYDKNQLVKAAAGEEKKAAALQKASVAADPRTALADKYTKDLAAYQTYKDQQLITDLQYEELRNAAATQYDAQRLAAQEQMFAAQSRGNAFMIDSLNALQGTSTQVFTGLITGAMSGQDAVRALANTIFNQAVGAVVEWGFAQLKAIVMGQTAQAAATAAGIAQGAALQVAYAPAAIAASIASFGAAPAAASASMAANVPIMAATLTAGRRNGGNVSAGGMYRVNEGGAPEIFTGGNGQQYLMPNKRGQVTSNADATSGGPAINIQVINNSSRSQVRTETREDEMGKFVSFFVDDMESGGEMFRGLASVSNVTRVGQ